MSEESFMTINRATVELGEPDIVDGMCDGCGRKHAICWDWDTSDKPGVYGGRLLCASCSMSFAYAPNGVAGGQGRTSRALLEGARVVLGCVIVGAIVAVCVWFKVVR